MAQAKGLRREKNPADPCITVKVFQVKDLDKSRPPQQEENAKNPSRKRRIKNLGLAGSVTVFQELAEDKVRL